jgi:putative phage-type endonuclease
MSNQATFTPKTITPANRQEWLDLRDKGIGASEIASVLNINKYQTPYDLWLVKTGKAPPFQENKFSKAGKMLEGAVVQYFQEETNIEVVPGYDDDIVFIHPDKPFVRVTPDRILNLNPGHANLEAKTTQFNIDPESIPPTWFVQTQYQSGCLGFEIGYNAWLSRGVDFNFVSIDADPEYFAYLVDQAERFWTKHVLTDIPPDPVNEHDVQQMYNKHSKNMYIQGYPELIDLAASLKEAQQARIAWEKREKELKSELSLVLLDAEGIIYNDEVVLTYKTQNGKSYIDRNELENDHPLLHDKYLKQGNPYRVMRVKNV